MNDGHLSFDELAELDEELLDATRAAEAQAHLAGCVECRARLEAIVAARRALADLPPEPMPADVAARLDRALSDAGTPSGDVVPDLSDYRRRRFSRPTMAGSAAAAVIVLAVGALIIGHLGSGTSSGGGAGGSSATGSVQSEPQGVAQPKNYTKTSTGTNYTSSRLLSEVPALVAQMPTEFQEPEANGSITTPGVPAPTASASGVRSPDVQPSRPVPAALRPLFDSRAKILSCAARITSDPHAVPITIDVGSWTSGDLHKVPAAIFVMRDADSKVVDVYVTNATCSGNLPILDLVKVPLN